jgi:hypothetical protein
VESIAETWEKAVKLEQLADAQIGPAAQENIGGTSTRCLEIHKGRNLRE